MTAKTTINYTVFTKTELVFETNKLEYSDKGVKFKNEDDEYFIPYENINYIIR